MGVAVGRWRWERIKLVGKLKRRLKHGKPFFIADSMAWPVVPCFLLWYGPDTAELQYGPIAAIHADRRPAKTD